MDDLSLRVYLENGSDAMRGGWLELPVVPERLDAFMRGVVGVDDGGGYAVVDHEPGWFGDVLGSDLESFSVSSLNLAARCVAHARDLAVADSVDGDVFLDMLATAAESEDVRFPSGIAALAARAGDVAEFWTESYSVRHSSQMVSCHRVLDTCMGSPSAPSMVWGGVSHWIRPFWSILANFPWVPSVRSVCPVCHASIALRLSLAYRPFVCFWAMPLWAMYPCSSLPSV